MTPPAAFARLPVWGSSFDLSVSPSDFSEGEAEDAGLFEQLLGHVPLVAVVLFGLLRAERERPRPFVHRVSEAIRRGLRRKPCAMRVVTMLTLHSPFASPTIARWVWLSDVSICRPWRHFSTIFLMTQRVRAYASAAFASAFGSTGFTRPWQLYFPCVGPFCSVQSHVRIAKPPSNFGSSECTSSRACI